MAPNEKSVVSEYKTKSPVSLCPLCAHAKITSISQSQRAKPMHTIVPGGGIRNPTMIPENKGKAPADSAATTRQIVFVDIGIHGISWIVPFASRCRLMILTGSPVALAIPSAMR